MFAQGPALQLGLAFVHMLHGLHGHLISMLGHYWTFTWVIGVCKLSSGSKWVYIVSLRMRALEAECPGMRQSVCFATQGHCVMRNIWCFSALVCKHYVMSVQFCFQTCVQWSNFCGKMTWLVLPNLFMHV